MHWLPGALAVVPALPRPGVLGKLREATTLPAHPAALPANGDMTLSIINALGRINGCA